MNRIFSFSTLQAFALATWALVTLLSHVHVFTGNAAIQWPLLTLQLLFGAVLFMATVPDAAEGRRFGLLLTCLYLLYVCICFVSPFGFSGIYLVLLSSLLLLILPLRTALCLSPIMVVPQAMSLTIVWEQSQGWLTAILFWSFNLFAMLMMDSRKQALRAKEEAESLNRELQATQSLLALSVKEAERTRIARDLHDVAGHHLTALAIHLQVAEHKSSPELKPVIGQCRTIAADLLSDVRQAVSDIRSDTFLSLNAALSLLASSTERYTVTVNTDHAPALPAPLIEPVFRIAQEAVTNSLRHGRASQITVKADTGNQAGLELTICDNGTGSSAPVAGNGMKGMKERAVSAGGNIAFNSSEHGFEVKLSLPGDAK